MPLTIFSLFYSTDRVNHFVQHCEANLGKVTLHYFPDQECCIQIQSEIDNHQVIIFDSLNNPNPKIIPLLYLAQTARSLGAKEVGFVAPYLSYMRQDKVFKPGEGISAEYFSEILSKYFDWMITLDPHLHRYKSLDQIYTIPTQVAHAGPIISDWIGQNIEKPILIGPDQESEQWLKSVTQKTNIPYLVLEKTRHGDKEVEVSNPKLENYLEYTPVLVDDIISSGRTMLETIIKLKSLTPIQPTCIGTHGIFADDCYLKLKEQDLKNIITTNSIEHPTNNIDIDPLLVSKLFSKKID